MKIELGLSDILGFIEEEYEVMGDANVSITGFASIERSQSGDLTFIQDKRYLKKAQQCEAKILLVPYDIEVVAPKVVTQIKTKSPTKVLSQICGKLEANLYPLERKGIHPTAIIHESCKIGDSCHVGPYSVIEEGVELAEDVYIGARVTIGANVKIGKGVVIRENVMIEPHTEIGEGSRLFAGVVIGTIGFGFDFIKEEGRYQSIPQVGRVIIGKHVDVGANSAIDRARFGVTQIGDGTKIDNLVQIGHNVIIGKHCIVCSQVGIAGTTNIGDYCVFAGQVGIADHLEIAGGTQVGGKAAVTSSVKEPGKKIWGIPAYDYGLAAKTGILQKRIPDLFKRFGEVEKQLKELKAEE